MQKRILHLHLTILIVSICLLLGCAGNKKLPDNYWESPVPSIKQTQRKLPFGDLRNYQYCEVIPTFRKGDSLITEVYNTILCNKCPENKWYQLTESELKSKLGAESVKLNGPRHWVINKAKGTGNVQYDKIASFGDVQMRLAAQIDGEIEENTYTEITVKRWTTWIYKKGNEVYKLVNPKGEEYIMQSYSRIIDKEQGIDDLSQLSLKLSLPKGWSFKTEILEKEFRLISDGQAFVVVDSLRNTYQKIVNQK